MATRMARRRWLRAGNFDDAPLAGVKDRPGAREVGAFEAAVVLTGIRAVGGSFGGVLCGVHGGDAAGESSATGGFLGLGVVLGERLVYRPRDPSWAVGVAD